MRSPTPRQWTAIALAAVALPALTYTAWPLIPFLTGLLPEALPVGRLLWGLLFAAVLVAAVVLGRSSIRASPPWLGWLILLAWAVAIAAVTGIVLIVWLILGFPGLEEIPHLSPKNLDAIATRAFAIVAGLGGVALLVISYRRQRTTEADAERAERASEREATKLFTERFTTASEQLGSEHAAVRLAGVHALAHLADDAPEDREDLVQMVIDVLCAYLRMPYTPEPEASFEHPIPPVLPSASSATAINLDQLGGFDADADQREEPQADQEKHRKRVLEFGSFREVRHTIIRIIGDRLRKDTRWRGKDYDFTGVVFDGCDLSRAHFTGGRVSFHRSQFTDGRMDFSGVQFTGGEVDFSWSRFTGGTVNFREAGFMSGKVDFSQAWFIGGRVDFSGARFTGGRVDFNWTDFIGGMVSFSRAEFTGGKVDFDWAEFTGGKVDFNGARFTGGEMNFSQAQFTDETVHFDNVSGERPRHLPSHLWQPEEDEDPEPDAS